MADSVTLLVDEVLPHQPMRQWVLSVPFPLRVGRYLERQGLLERDTGNCYPNHETRQLKDAWQKPVTTFLICLPLRIT